MSARREPDYTSRSPPRYMGMEHVVESGMMCATMSADASMLSMALPFAWR